MSAVTAIAGYIESFVPPPHKEALRLSLTRIAERSVIPPDALLLFEKIFGKRLISPRSLIVSLCVSILGAVITAGLIYATSDEASVNVGRDAIKFIREFPVIALVFCAVFLLFDYFSFLVTAVFVRMAAASASKRQAILLFLADAGLSISVCLIGLALASTIAVHLAPRNFWPEATERSFTGPDAAIQSIDAASDTQFAFAPETYQLLVPPSVSPTTARLIQQDGIIAYARTLPVDQSKGLSPLVQVMLGRVGIEDIVGQINAGAIGYQVEETSCSGAQTLSDFESRELLRSLYGGGERPACPLPTLIWRPNVESLYEISINRADDVFLGMLGLYLHELVYLLQSKLTAYVVITPQSQWREVVYDSTPSNEASWFGNAYDLTRTEDQFPMRALDSPPSTPQVDTSPPHAEPTDAGSTAEDDWHTDDWYVYDNTYDVYEEWGAPRIPISPFFGSALWMSILFYLFVVYSVLAKFALGAWNVAVFVIKRTIWADKPVQLVGGAIALCVGLIILLVFIADAPAPNG